MSVYVPQDPTRHTRQARSKYRNTKVRFQGENFDSIGERDRWIFLQDAQRSGKICNLQRQVRYPLVVNGIEICTIVPDYSYNATVQTDFGPSLGLIVSDFKGGYAIPADWLLKAKLLKAIHGIEIHIVKKASDPLIPLEKHKKVKK